MFVNGLLAAGWAAGCIATATGAWVPPVWAVAFAFGAHALAHTVQAALKGLQS